MGVSKFIETIKTMISDEMYQNYFEDIQSDSEIIELKKFIENYINTKHIDKIKEFYKNYCAV
jgi:chromosomal replication initiation ATPase DnaA